MSETDQKTRSRFQHPLARVLPLAGGVLGAMAFAITVIPLDLPWASSNAESPAVVTFDTAKYVNARRAAASELLGDGEARDSAVSTLARVDNGVRPAIVDAADGALVIVRQAAVLDGTIPDITDTVLAGLGLPTDAPMETPLTAHRTFMRRLESWSVVLTSKRVSVPIRSARRELKSCCHKQQMIRT